MTPASLKMLRKMRLYLVEEFCRRVPAKQGRDRKFQAILPLRGKGPQQRKSQNGEHSQKQRNHYHLIYTIGAGVGADFNLDDINYDKLSS